LSAESGKEIKNKNARIKMAYENSKVMVLALTGSEPAVKPQAKYLAPRFTWRSYTIFAF